MSSRGSLIILRNRGVLVPSCLMQYGVYNLDIARQLIERFCVSRKLFGLNFPQAISQILAQLDGLANRLARRHGLFLVGLVVLWLLVAFLLALTHLLDGNAFLKLLPQTQLAPLIAQLRQFDELGLTH
jgi:uncharacterized protein YjeT (DUF2065 family)